MGTDKTIHVKLFVDADTSSTKVAVNVLNQPSCNSSYAHCPPNAGVHRSSGPSQEHGGHIQGISS